MIIPKWINFNKVLYLSKIFTKSELEEIKRREEGDKSDKFGLFSGRIRPKIEEILSFDLKELKELVKRND